MNTTHALASINWTETYNMLRSIKEIFGWILFALFVLFAVLCIAAVKWEKWKRERRMKETARNVFEAEAHERRNRSWEEQDKRDRAELDSLPCLAIFFVGSPAIPSFLREQHDFRLVLSVFMGLALAVLFVWLWRASSEEALKKEQEKLFDDEKLTHPDNVRGCDFCGCPFDMAPDIGCRMCKGLAAGYISEEQYDAELVPSKKTVAQVVEGLGQNKRMFDDEGREHIELIESMAKPPSPSKLSPEDEQTVLDSIFMCKHGKSRSIDGPCPECFKPAQPVQQFADIEHGKEITSGTLSPESLDALQKSFLDRKEPIKIIGFDPAFGPSKAIGYTIKDGKLGDPIKIPTDELRNGLRTDEAPKWPRSTAYRLSLSPHEWTWTQEEQEEMAREVLRWQGVESDILTTLGFARDRTHNVVDLVQRQVSTTERITKRLNRADDRSKLIDGVLKETMPLLMKLRASLETSALDDDNLISMQCVLAEIVEHVDTLAMIQNKRDVQIEIHERIAEVVDDTKK